MTPSTVTMRPRLLVGGLLEVNDRAIVITTRTRKPDEGSTHSLVRSSRRPDARRSARDHAACRFRNGCRRPSSSQPAHSQPPLKSPQTCFEGPFGELLRATGPVAKANPFRFSTKYQDDETDFLYYGFRYYNPSTGRWLTRDPSDEAGGLNLYNPEGNDLAGRIDLLGLAACEINSFSLTGYWAKDHPDYGPLTFQIRCLITWSCSDCTKSCCQIERLIKMKVSRNGVPINVSTSGIPLDGYYHNEPPQNLSDDHCVYKMFDSPGFQSPLNSGDGVLITGTVRIKVKDVCKGGVVANNSISFSASGKYPDKLKLDPQPFGGQ